MNQFIYCLRDVKHGLKRNIVANVASVILIFISLLFVGMFLLFSQTTSQLTFYLESQIKIQFYLHETNEENERNLQKELESNENIITVQYRNSKELQQLAQQIFNQNKSIVNSFDENDFPTSFIVEVKEPEKTKEIIKQYENHSYIEEIIYPQAFTEQILKIKETMQTAFIFILLFLIIASIITVFITINLSMSKREKELKIKLLLGANNTYIRIQFLTEATIIGFFSSIFSVGCLTFLYQFVIQKIKTYNIAFLEGNWNAFVLIACFVIGFGFLITLAGSYLSTNRWLKKENQ